METWKKVAIAGGGIAVFSFLPIFRTAEKEGINLFQFLHHHTKYGDEPKDENRWEDEDGKYHIEWVYEEAPSNGEE